MAKKVISLDDLPVVGNNNTVHRDSEIYSTGAVLLMDKPLDWTSFDVVNYVRNRIPPKKVGHAGTLDPLASGLLILCTGKATKSISQIQELDKTYEAKIKFGASTPSYDAEAEPDITAQWNHISREMISEILQQKFTGQIDQVPPAYSAIKVKGERMYKLARRGIDIALNPRKITIHEINILDVSLPEVTIRIRCGKGTYIRSLAHDLGIELGSRAHLIGLKRTSIGHFDVKDAVTPEEFNQFPK